MFSSCLSAPQTWNKCLENVSTTALRKVLMILCLADTGEKDLHWKEKKVFIHSCLDLGLFQGQGQSSHSVTAGSTTGFKS